jgi:WD40 repeat protein
MTMFATGGREELENSKSPVKVWDVKTGALVATLEGHTDWVGCLTWTSDGKTLISGSADHSIRTWNTSNWKQIAVLEGHINIVYGIAISSNGRILASASVDNTARLWNLNNNQPISSPLQHANVVYSVSFSADGKLLATSCFDDNAYTWEISAIVKEAGLDELLLDKRTLATDATQRPVRQPIKIYNRVPQGFFDGTPHPSARVDLRDTPSRSSISHWARNIFSARPSSPDIELRERHSGVVDVPYCQPKRRNATAKEKRGPNSATNTSRHPNSNATQQSTGGAQAQTSSQTQATILTSSTALPVTNTTSHTNPHATIESAGRWTRFWLFFCCTSPKYTHDHH